MIGYRSAGGLLAASLLLLGDVPGRPASGPPATLPVSLPNTEVRSLKSRHTGAEYRIDVALPAEYARTADRYPLVCLLDADYSFAIVRNVVEHLSDRNGLPKMIVAAVGYDGPPNYRINRTRDYTPTRSPTGGYGPEYQAHSGGGPRFRAFLEDELLPFLQARYRLSDERTLVGHSYGGLFTGWVLLTRPQLFTGYVLVSPSLWYDGRLLFQVEADTAETRRSLAARAFLGVGSREGNAERDMVVDLERFGERIQRASPGLAVRTVVFDDETHDSVFPAAVSKGLRFVHRGR